MIAHWNGSTWTTLARPTYQSLTSVHGAGGSVYAVGDAAQVFRYVP
jgi:hypothetical protein